MQKLTLTPNKLSLHLTQQIAEACKCEGLWTQHSGPLTEEEIAEVRFRINGLLDRLVPAEVVA